MSEETTLIEMPTINLPAVSEVKEKVNEAFKTIYTKIEKEIEETPVDVSTEKGRKALISLAYKISQTKTGLDASAKGLTEDQKDMIDAVNEERREMRETLDKLRDQVRGPVTAWETKEKERETFVADAFLFLRNITAQEYQGVAYIDLDADQVVNLAGFVSIKSPCDKEVFKEAAESYDQLVAHTKKTLEEHAERLRVAEKERKELEELRAKQAAEEEARLAAEAKAAEERRIEAEKERLAAEAARVAEAEARQKIEDEKRRAAEAEEAARRAEQEKVEAEAELARQAEQAERDKKAAEEAAAVAAKEAAAKAEREKQAAIEEDRRKREDAERAERAAAQARADDLAHRKKINNAALEALIKVSEISEVDGKTIIKAIAEGKVPNITVKY